MSPALFLVMGLIEQAMSDVRQIMENSNDFGVTITFTSPDADVAEVTGTHSKHHIGVDEGGYPINSKNAHVTVAEASLTDLNYPIRNDSGEVSILRHRVQVSDSTGLAKEYVVKETLPDETLGIIVCILGDYA